MRKTAKRIGLAIVGAGRVGLFRGEVAARHPMVDFIGLADLKEDRLELVGLGCDLTFERCRAFGHGASGFGGFAEPRACEGPR